MTRTEIPIYTKLFGRTPIWLVAGASVDATNDKGLTPLHEAVWANANLAEVEALLAAGASVDATYKYSATPLHEAIWWNAEPAVVEVLLAAGASVDV